MHPQGVRAGKWQCPAFCAPRRKNIHLQRSVHAQGVRVGKWQCPAFCAPRRKNIHLQRSVHAQGARVGKWQSPAFCAPTRSQGRKIYISSVLCTHKESVRVGKWQSPAFCARTRGSGQENGNVQRSVHPHVPEVYKLLYGDTSKAGTLKTHKSSVLCTHKGKKKKEKDSSCRLTNTSNRGTDSQREDVSGKTPTREQLPLATLGEMCPSECGQISRSSG